MKEGANARGRKAPLEFDPIEEAVRQWSQRWPRAAEMAAFTSIMRAQRIVLDAVDPVLMRFGLNFARYEVLVLLHVSRTGALPLGKMGNRLQVHPTSVTNAVDRLEAQGFVRRLRHPSDRRTILAEITEAGRSVVERATPELTLHAFTVPELRPSDFGAITQAIYRLRLAAGDFAAGHELVSKVATRIS